MDESKLAKLTWALKFSFRSSLPGRCPFRTNLSLQTNRKIMQFSQDENVEERNGLVWFVAAEQRMNCHTHIP